MPMLCLWLNVLIITPAVRKNFLSDEAVSNDLGFLGEAIKSPFERDPLWNGIVCLRQEQPATSKQYLWSPSAFLITDELLPFPSASPPC